LLEAIQAHASGHGNGNGEGKGNQYPPSEANGVIRQFNNLASADKQAILDFLRSL
jgi:hypothetical protein